MIEWSFSEWLNPNVDGIKYWVAFIAWMFMAFSIGFVFGTMV